ncbi:DMT family transporter [Enterovirga sp. CN4-39]|uniref:DMT family transporter n=1 Tax=Enterovirga sp. CN4-39 TaxID=3400910 RepID=UPI003C0D7FB7
MSGWSAAALAFAIVCEVVGTTALAASHGFTRLVPSVVCAGSYALAFYALSIALKGMPVGIAYAIWAGIGIVLISLAGWIGFGQRLDAPAIAGIGLIVAGVLVINLLSASARLH